MNCFKTMIVSMVGLGLIVIVGCSSVQRQDSSVDKKAMFNAFDKNQDNRVGRMEYYLIWKDKKIAEEYFNRLDRDGSGFLTEGEFAVPSVAIPLRK
jgi:Ca2+-binding EF-hand superfamily protein